MRIHARPFFAVLSAIAMTSFLCAPAAAPDDEFKLEEGFTSLFSGKDLTGWRLGQEVLDGKTQSADKRFKAQDGAIVIQGAAKIEDLYTVAEFNRDFILRLEFRAGPKANSGLYLRGKQLQVRDYATIGPYKDLKHFHEGGWNAIEVKVTANVAECTCNGEMLEKALAIPEKGGIGLKSETAQLEYRRIRIKQAP